MKTRTLPRKLRNRIKISEAITGKWIFGGKIATSGCTLTFTDLVDDSIVYYDSNPTTTVTFPSNAFGGFQVGDIITISGHGDEKIKKKKKVHVARRRKKEKQQTHTITDIHTTTMTITTNGLTTATKVAKDEWIVYEEIS